MEINFPRFRSRPERTGPDAGEPARTARRRRPGAAVGTIHRRRGCVSESRRTAAVCTPAARAPRAAPEDCCKAGHWATVQYGARAKHGRARCVFWAVVRRGKSGRRTAGRFAQRNARTTGRRAGSK
ncbi:unnamed protein product, partial [Amoebophrya sp. A120]|eukprot:GSA120T00017487001.1